MRLEISERLYPQGLFEPTPRVRAWSKALLVRPSVREAVVADFEARFRQRFVAMGGWLGQRLA